jgi:hypothetical protein
MGNCDVEIQAAKDARASQDTLIIFENMEILFEYMEILFEYMKKFFRRLEAIEVTLTTEMMDIITKIMAMVLVILGTATKEIKRARMSELFVYKYTTVD